LGKIFQAEVIAEFVEILKNLNGLAKNNLNANPVFSSQFQQPIQITLFLKKARAFKKRE
jgi:hypothetical protein